MSYPEIEKYRTNKTIQMVVGGGSNPAKISVDSEGYELTIATPAIYIRQKFSEVPLYYFPLGDFMFQFYNHISKRSFAGGAKYDNLTNIYIQILNVIGNSTGNVPETIINEIYSECIQN